MRLCRCSRICGVCAFGLEAVLLLQVISVLLTLMDVGIGICRFLCNLSWMCLATIG